MTSARSRPALHLAAAAAVDLATAIDAFLSQPDLAPTTRAKYRRRLALVEEEIGDAAVTGAGLAGGGVVVVVVALTSRVADDVEPPRRDRQTFARYCSRTRILEIHGDIELQR